MADDIEKVFGHSTLEAVNDINNAAKKVNPNGPDILDTLKTNAQQFETYVNAGHGGQTSQDINSNVTAFYAAQTADLTSLIKNGMDSDKRADVTAAVKALAGDKGVDALNGAIEAQDYKDVKPEMAKGELTKGVAEIIRLEHIAMAKAVGMSAAKEYRPGVDGESATATVFGADKEKAVKTLSDAAGNDKAVTALEANAYGLVAAHDGEHVQRTTAADLNKSAAAFYSGELGALNAIAKKRVESGDAERSAATDPAEKAFGPDVVAAVKALVKDSPIAMRGLQEAAIGEMQPGRLSQQAIHEGLESVIAVEKQLLQKAAQTAGAKGFADVEVPTAAPHTPTTQQPAQQPSRPH